MENKYIDLLDTITKQEEMLRFKHFTNEDALELGNFFLNEAKTAKISIAIAIRKINGAILYHHLMSGMTKDHQKWMERKYNTVCLLEHASLRYYVTEKGFGDSIKNHGLSEDNYVFCGGGFPIVLENGEFVAVLTMSSLPHFEDHRFIIHSLSKWLGVSDVPEANEV